MTTTHGLRRAALWLGATALLCGMTAGAWAQPGRDRDSDERRDRWMQPGREGQPGRFGGMEHFTEMFQPGFTSKDLDELAQRVGLSEDQAAAAEALFQGYLEQFNASAQIWRSEIEAMREEMREERDFSRLREIPALMLKWRAERAKMGQALQEEVKLLLDEKQQSRWVDWERAYRRQHALPEGRLAGEQLNLIELVEELDLSLAASGDLLDVLSQYEHELDRALQERETALPEVEQTMSEAMQEQDVEVALSAYKAGQELRQKVQEVNRRFAARCQALLPAERQQAFARKVQELSYPQVFRPTRAEGAFAAVLNLESLDRDQRAAVESLQERYQKDLEANRQAQIKQIDGAETSDEPRWLERMRQREEGDGEDGGDWRDRFDPENMPDEMRVRMEQRELERDTLRHLRDTLTEQQLESLRDVIGEEREGWRPGGPGGPGRPGEGDSEV